MSSPRLPMHRHYSGGFTLIEMAVVVVVMALILGSILVPLSTQIMQRQVADAQRQLEDIKEALIGFALAQPTPALPCPDKITGATTSGLGGVTNSPGDGLEDVAVGGTCEEAEGSLPWVTLGIGAADPWGNRFRYRVTVTGPTTIPPSPQGFAQRPPSLPFNLAQEGELHICRTRDPNPPFACLANESISVIPSPRAINAPAALVMSHGPNGWGGINASTGVMNIPSGCGTTTIVGCASVSINEQENADTDVLFISRAASASGSAAGEFDDVVVWISPHTLKYRLVAGGKLP